MIHRRGVVAGALGMTIAAAAPVDEFTLRGAILVDGTGGPPRRADVTVRDGRISGVGADAGGGRTVDAGGLVLAPGFIDTHSHHDRGLAEHPDALEAISQGVTTIVVGQDGSSSLPLAAYLAGLDARPPAINVAAFAGHGTLRAAVMGQDYKRPATRPEVEAMRRLLGPEMAAGAFGLSSGLEYDPGLYATTAELVALARDAGRYATHIRSEDRALWAALDEAIQVGRGAGVPVQVSHMKLGMPSLWGQASGYIGRLEAARSAGVAVAGDVYPYEYWQSTLAVFFPERNLADRAAAELAMRDIARPQDVVIARYDADPSLVGRTVAQIAAARGQDAAAALMALAQGSPKLGETDSIIATGMSSADVAALVAWPASNICSDGALAGRHPRGAGAFTKVLRLYVRQEQRLTLEAAVHKMTQLASQRIGLGRGVIQRRYPADLVLFDPATVADRATTENPSALSVGVEKVWVNGRLALEHGGATGVRAGQALRRPGAGRA